MIDEYSSTPLKNYETTTPVVINYPHIKERIIKFKNAQMKKRSSFGDNDKKRIFENKEYNIANIYTQQLSPKGSPIREESQIKVQ